MGQRLVVEIVRNDSPIANVYYHWSAYTCSAIEVAKSMCQYVLRDANTMSDNELRLALIRFAENSFGVGYLGDETKRSSALAEINGMLQTTEDTPSYDMMMKILLSHGGLCPQDVQYAKELFKELSPDEEFAQDVNRNRGLVAISEHEMEASLNWAEGTITINLDNQSIHNDVLFCYSLDEYNDARKASSNPYCQPNDTCEDIDDWDDGMCCEDEEYDESDSEDDFGPEADAIDRIDIDISQFVFDEIDQVLAIVATNHSSWFRFEDKIFQIIQ